MAAATGADRPDLAGAGAVGVRPRADRAGAAEYRLLGRVRHRVAARGQPARGPAGRGFTHGPFRNQQ
ncbi:MAG: hypothetical protein FJ381_15375 [Verrucomicrobia bacterium]|nr:hypothetical protein [Verrucomicrobiota bacterium]